MSTGFTLDGFPSMGAWVSYALGSENEQLARVRRHSRSARRAAIRASPTGDPDFCRPSFRGRPSTRNKPIRHLAPPAGIAGKTDQATRDFLKLLNEQHLEQFPGDTRIGGPHRQLRTGRPHAVERSRDRPIYRTEPGTHFEDVRRRRYREQAEGRLCPQLHSRAAAYRAGRALRAALQRRLRHGRRRRQLGRPQDAARSNTTFTARFSISPPPRCSTDLEAARTAGRHAGRLVHRVRPHAHVSERGQRPRPQPARLHRPGWPAPA